MAKNAPQKAFCGDISTSPSVVRALKSLAGEPRAYRGPAIDRRVTDGVRVGVRVGVSFGVVVEEAALGQPASAQI